VKQEVDAQVKEFEALDEWRYESLPGLVEARIQGKANADSEEGERKKGDALSKDEVVKLMEWKLYVPPPAPDLLDIQVQFLTKACRKHGVYRPVLLGMIKSNQEKSIQSATRDAFSLIQQEEDGSASGLDFQGNIQKGLDALTTPLRGVGPATASLILSVGSADVPFYSDDVFLWLCVGDYPATSNAAAAEEEKNGKDGGERSKEVRPNGELNVKYNIPEYKRLWDAVQRLRARLNEEAGEDEGISCADVERVALVVRHFDQSGLQNEAMDREDVEDGKRKKRRTHHE
jgi:ADA HAT complex component 1